MSVVDSNPLLDVIVCNYKTPHDLERFGESYVEQDYPSSLVIVNVEPDRSDVAVAEELMEVVEDVIYVEFPTNIGYAAAINYGASITAAPILAAFNADVELSPKSLQHCCERLESQANWGVLGPIQVDEQGRLTHSGIFGSNHEPTFEGAWHKRPDERHFVIREAVSVSGAAYFVKRSVWDELSNCPIYKQVFPNAQGAFLPTPFYYEEMGCSLHARDHGYSVIYDGTLDPPLIHRWHRSVRQNGMEQQAGRWLKESLELFRMFCDAHAIDHE